MRITEVSYRELVSGPGYRHTAVEVRATGGPGETPELALHRAEWWVRNQFAERRMRAADEARLGATKAQLERDIRDLARWRDEAVVALRLVTRWRVLREDLRRWWD